LNRACRRWRAPRRPGPQWAYEIWHDGFRFIYRRDGERVRAFSAARR
jgi:ATP-dependent DNA ligase